MNILSKSGIYSELNYSIAGQNYNKELAKIIDELKADKLNENYTESKITKVKLKQNDEMSRRNSIKDKDAEDERLGVGQYESIERRMRRPFRNMGRVIRIHNIAGTRIPLIDGLPAL